MADRKIRKKDCVRLSNKIIQRCHLNVAPVSDIGDIKSDLFINLLQVLCGPELPQGIAPFPSSAQQEADNVQIIINHLALDLIHVDLNHITGAAVIGGDARAIYNLLEIFCGLHKYLSSTDIGNKWNLEESLTETEEEISDGSSASDKDGEDDIADGAEAANDASANLPPSSRGSLAKSGAKTSSGSMGNTGGSTSRSTNPTTSTSSKTDGGDVSFPVSEFSLQHDLPLSPPTQRPAAENPVAADRSGIIPPDIMPSSPQLPGSGSSADTSTTGNLPRPDHEPIFRKNTAEPFEPRHFDFEGGEMLQDEERDETETTTADDDDERVDDEDYSHQVTSDDTHLKGSSSAKTSSGTEPPSSEKEPAPTVPSSEKEPTPMTTEESTPSQRERHGKSAPSTPAAKMAAASRLRRRLDPSDCSSASDPGIGQKVTGRRPLLTRNIETIAEIRESGGERATVHTTRQQLGNRLCKEVTRKELKRKTHSAPQPARTSSFGRQSSGRSACSEGVLQWLESQSDDAPLQVQGQETDVFEFLRHEFPYVHVTEETKRKLLCQYRQQMRYIMSLTEPTETRKYKIRRQDVLRRHALLTDIIREQKQHDKRARKIMEQKRCEIRARNAPRDAKIACLRAQRYVDAYKHQFQSRVAHNRSKEELLMKSIFEEMLEIQRTRLRTVRRMEKGTIEDYYGEDGYTMDVNRMLLFYEANYRDLTQMLMHEKEDLHISEKEQQKLAERIRREFRAYMEQDVKSLNDKLVNSWQPQYRDLDADRIRNELYQANWKFCVA